jgi:hypothetical protein
LPAAGFSFFVAIPVLSSGGLGQTAGRIRHKPNLRIGPFALFVAKISAAWARVVTPLHGGIIVSNLIVTHE